MPAIPRDGALRAHGQLEQVRPLNRDGVGQWKAFEAQLGPPGSSGAVLKRVTLAPSLRLAGNRYPRPRASWPPVR